MVWILQKKLYGKVLNNFMLKLDLFQLIASLLNVKSQEIKIDSTPDQFSSWDSFKHMEIILAIEDKYSIKLTDKGIAQIRNVEDMYKTLKNHGIN